MSEHEDIRTSVAEAYARSVTKPGSGGCCSEPAQKGVAAKLAGYTAEELQSLPREAVVNSFGCGNPVAVSELKEGQVVLDLGSGAGIDILLAAGKVGPTGRAIGIDMTDEMLAKARENIEASGLSNVEVRKGIIEAMPVEDGTVDWVISNCVINLSPEKERVFSEIARVLKPGGQMLVSDIVVENLPEWVRRDEELYASCVAGAISEKEYAAGLRGAGLEAVEVRDRLAYSDSQVEAFVGSELQEVGTAQGCCGSSLSGGSPQKIAEAMTGKVQSVLFYARKPS